MLVQFSVENFLSFNEEQIFSMVAATGDQRHPSHIVPGDIAGSGGVLRCAAIYGPNGAGKSNLIEAISFARDLIVSGTPSGRSLPVRSFKLAATVDVRLSKFEFVIRTQGLLFNYGFRLNTSRIVDEWLFETRGGRETPLFERSTSESGDVTVDFGPELTQRRKQQTQFLQFVARGTRPNQLFLTETDDRNVAQVKPVMDWFRNTLTIISADPNVPALETDVHFNKSLGELMTRYLFAAGTGIEYAETRQVPVDLSTLFPELPDDLGNRLRDKITTLPEMSGVHIQGPNGRRYHVARDQAGELVRIEMQLHHQAENGARIAFTVDEESDGTQRLIQLIPALHMMQSGGEHVILLDELDRRFHPHLSRMFVQLALSATTEGTLSQLVFTTHDTNLLDLDLLRRDEIWFVEKDKVGASHIYSLAEFKIRPDLKIEKGYLNGRFGAIPFITPISELGWADDPSAAENQSSDEPAVAV
ncbi:MAG: AAA family ATPase [Capsulimonadaceae bacterium]